MPVPPVPAPLPPVPGSPLPPVPGDPLVPAEPTPGAPAVGAFPALDCVPAVEPKPEPPARAPGSPAVPSVAPPSEEHPKPVAAMPRRLAVAKKYARGERRPILMRFDIFSIRRRSDCPVDGSRRDQREWSKKATDALKECSLGWRARRILCWSSAGQTFRCNLPQQSPFAGEGSVRHRIGTGSAHRKVARRNAGRRQPVRGTGRWEPACEIPGA